MSQLEVQAARGELAKCERWARAVLADCELIRYTTANEGNVRNHTTQRLDSLIQRSAGKRLTLEALTNA
jgi:hypothetical protein